MALEARLTQSLTQSLAQAAAQTARATSGLTDRLQSMERILEAGAGEGGRHWTELSERFGSLETSFRARPQSAAAPEMGELVERVGGLERAVRAGFGDSLRSAATMSDRLAVVEKAALVAPATDDEALLLLDDRLQSIERMLQDQAGPRGAPATIDLAAIDLGSLAGPLTQRLTAIDQQSAERAARQEVLLRETAGRIAAIEQRVATGSAAQDESMRGRDREVAEMHEAIVRLSENQHTLASAIADWRHESHTDLGAVNAQIERLQSPGPAIASATDTSVTDFPSVARGGTARTSLDRQAEANAKTEYADGPVVPREPQQAPATRGRGFWWWLFGTGNVSQANRDAEMQWQRMHKSLKQNRERRQDRA